jgi:acetolactate synthase I/II/III large subunit
MATSANDLNADGNACAAWIARFLRARGVDRIFGLQGGHIQPIWNHAAQLGIRIIDVRHEAAAVTWRTLTPSLRVNSASRW